MYSFSNDPFSDGIWFYFWWVVPVAAVLLLSKSSMFKRLMAGLTVNLRARCHLDAERYHEYRNLDILCHGEHVHIDYVYVSRYGIFVVNTPNSQGRIWGCKHQDLWKQKFHKSETVFRNPLLENQEYIQTLSDKLLFSPRVFFSVVVFDKNCRFKTVMPDNVMEYGDFADYIAQYDEPILTELEVSQVRKTLETNEFDVVFDNRYAGSQAW